MSVSGSTMQGSDRPHSAGKSARIFHLAMVVGSVLGCGGEHFSAVGVLPNPEPTGSGGAGLGTDAGSLATGTGGAGGGSDGAGGENTGTGSTPGTETMGSGGSIADAGSNWPPATDAGDGGTQAMDAAADLSGSIDGGDAGDAPRDAFACAADTRDLSNVGIGDFRISFHILTMQTGWVALLNQRSVCSLGVFWDIRQNDGGEIVIETDNVTAASHQTVQSISRINDGQPHDVAVERKAGSLTIHIDGAPAVQGASSASLGAMPALRVGADVCGASNDPPTAPFAGTTLSNVCIIRE